MPMAPRCEAVGGGGFHRVTMGAGVGQSRTSVPILAPTPDPSPLLRCATRGEGRAIGAAVPYLTDVSHPHE
jgi:hypothetical protein